MKTKIIWRKVRQKGQLLKAAQSVARFEWDTQQQTFLRRALCRKIHEIDFFAKDTEISRAPMGKLCIQSVVCLSYSFTVGVSLVDPGCVLYYDLGHLSS